MAYPQIFSNELFKKTVARSIKTILRLSSLIILIEAVQERGQKTSGN